MKNPEGLEVFYNRDGGVHEYFGLSYCNYLTLPRSLLQSMPKKWQSRFMGLLEELDETGWKKEYPEGFKYFIVKPIGEKGHFITDPFGDYRRGRRDVFSERGREG